MSGIENEIRKLKNLSHKNLQSKNFERALSSISAAGYMSYHWNQYYTDEELESQIQEAADLIRKDFNSSRSTSENVVMFYDGFGVDSRGLALNYLQALLNSGKTVIYITQDKAENSQPVLEATLRNYLNNSQMTTCYFSEAWSGKKKISFLNDLLLMYNPESVFFYSLPYDVPGIIFMELLQGGQRRYFINLTDHAFWLGTRCADYYIDFRTYGTSVSKNYRKISEDKICLLPYYPFVNQEISYNGLPFELAGRKLIYSGGALYKTFGDKENKYYQIVDFILKNYADTVFYYVGDGDKSELEKLQKAYPKRVFYSEERKDFFHIYEDSFFYLNTFPLVGGLMMQYAAMSGKLPLTLRHNNDGDGILIDQENLGIEYDDLNSLKTEIDNLIKNPEYKLAKEKRLKNAVPSPADFQRNLEKILCQQETEYKKDFKPIDTSDFLKVYRERIDEDAVVTEAIVQMSNKSLFWNYPGKFISKAIKKVRRKLSKS